MNINAVNLARVAYENWHVNNGADLEFLKDMGYSTPESLEDDIARTMQRAGEQLVQATATIVPVKTAIQARRGNPLSNRAVMLNDVAEAKRIHGLEL